jgi:imidazolonepropionase-like amidohydrolase
MNRPSLLLTGADYIDVVDGRVKSDHSVRIDAGKIVEVSKGRLRARRGEQRMDLAGRVLMPGLIDCHVHCSPHLSGPLPAHSSTLTLIAARRAYRMLRRGFTSVRDAGGTDAGLKDAIARRIVPGPRLFVSGKALSQSGGHGDPRSEFERSALTPGSGESAGFGRVADGATAFLRAAREELRLGADQIKIVACGGVGSSTGSLDQVQLADDEIRSAVDEATRAGTYVMAHAYHARGVRRLVELGVRTIEHGNLIDQETATLMAACGTYLVPNYVAYRSLAMHGREQGYPERGMARLDAILAAGTSALEFAVAAGVKVAYGSDLVRDPESQSDEFLIRTELQRPVDVIRSATVVGAEVLQRAGELGVVKVGAQADLLAIDGDPLSDISLLTNQGRAISLIIKDGYIEKDALRADPDQHWISRWYGAEDPRAR